MLVSLKSLFIPLCDNAPFVMIMLSWNMQYTHEYGGTSKVKMMQNAMLLQQWQLQNHSKHSPSSKHMKNSLLTMKNSTSINGGQKIDNFPKWCLGYVWAYWAFEVILSLINHLLLASSSKTKVIRNANIKSKFLIQITYELFEAYIPIMSEEIYTKLGECKHTRSLTSKMWGQSWVNSTVGENYLGTVVF